MAQGELSVTTNIEAKEQRKKPKKIPLKSTKYILLLIYSILILFPISLVVFATFKETTELYANPLGLPEVFTFSNFTRLFQEQAMGQYFLNSVLVTICTVGFVLLFASMISYAIIRIPGKIGWLLYGVFALGMMIPAQVNMIPLYSVVSKLGLLDSLFGLILVSIGVFMPVAVFIIAGFMKALPKELIEASFVDGASEWHTYSRVVLPLSLPSMSATAIFLFVMSWNDLLYPLMFISSQESKTLPLALLQFQGQYVTDFPMLFAGVLISSAPMVLAYLFLQKYFIAGMTAGSVKG